MSKDKKLDLFLKKNNNKQTVLIQGLGFVGSVMALVCSNSIKKEYAVIGVELDNSRGKKIINNLNNGIFPLSAQDSKIDQFFKKTIEKGNFFATSDNNAYRYADVIIVDINLDVDKKNDNSGELNVYDVNLASFKKAITTIGRYCKANALILVETTVPPGTCEKLVKPIIHACLKKRKLSVDKIKIGHSYERVMPGPGYIDSIQNFYRVYAGINEISANAVEDFLHTIIYTNEYPLTRLGNTNSSEIAKVLENSYRSMNIAFMVEWSRFAEESGVDIYDVVDAIRLRPTHSNLMYPGIGVGGYCLTKDALLASWSKQNLVGQGEPLYQSEASININDQMPRFAFEFLKKNYPPLLNARILLLGVSYRGDVGDTRYSPVKKFYDFLSKAGAIIDCHDPYVDYWEEQSLSMNKELIEHLNQRLDIIIFSTGHSLYNQDETLEMIYNLDPLFIFDTIGHLSKKQVDFLKKKHSLKILGRGDI